MSSFLIINLIINLIVATFIIFLILWLGTWGLFCLYVFYDKLLEKNEDYKNERKIEKLYKKYGSWHEVCMKEGYSLCIKCQKIRYCKLYNDKIKIY